MKIATIALAAALASISSFALAQSGSSGDMSKKGGEPSSMKNGNTTGGSTTSGMHGTGTTGVGSGGSMEKGTSNGTAGGPTSVSGTGSSMDGGQKPADTGKH